MAALKGKVKDLKDISNETDIGGAPYFGDDILRVQINSKANFINTFETYREKLGGMFYNRGASPSEELHKFGLILSGLTYDNTDPANPIINPGYFLSEGEVVYFPGGTWATGGSPAIMVYLRKGNLLAESRVFEDGGNKEFLVEYEAEVFVTDLGATGPVVEPLPSADLTKDFVAISIGGGSYFGYENWAEKNCSLEKSLDLIGIEERQVSDAFTDVSTFGTGWAVNTDVLGKIGSKVTQDGSTFITGSVVKTFAGETAADGVLTLSAENVNYSTGDLYFNVVGHDIAAGIVYGDYVCKISSAGTISVLPRNGGAFPTGDLVLHFNNIIVGTVASAYSKSYTYTPNFLDVTP